MFFEKTVDAAWVVSEKDQKWMRRLGGFAKVDIVPNGVDSEHYCAPQVDPEPESCIFWGRLDFAPNVNAIEYFLSEIWNRVRAIVPNACFHVCGSHPLGRLRKVLTSTPGVKFHENLDDLRPRIASSAVAVFPMVSGAGVKNKLLEAASMERAICATSRCLGGLRIESKPPFQLASTSHQWVETLTGYWRNQNLGKRFGQSARDWVVKNHSWNISADAALASIEGRQC